MPSARTSLLPVLQWSGRFGATLLVLLVLAIAIGEGAAGHFPDPLKQPWPVRIELLLLLPVMLAGLLAAWRWELAGAAAALAALIAFNAVELNVNHKPAGGAFPLFALPPLLLLAHAMIARREQRRRGGVNLVG
jgi:hypothetical protein